MVSKALLLLSAVISAVHSTQVHVNRGCILVDNHAICNGASVSITTGSALIYARFDGNSREDYVFPGCKLNARWPARYEHIFFGADNCLYDAGGKDFKIHILERPRKRPILCTAGNNINGQCCNIGTGGKQLVKNPYAS